MIEANVPGEATQTNVGDPQTITVSMILEDLENGIDRNAIKEKYSLQAWEVKQMFEHPALKGKKAKKVRKLSFNFIDDRVLDKTLIDPYQAGNSVRTVDPMSVEDQDPVSDPAQTSIPMSDEDGYEASPGVDLQVESENHKDDWKNSFE